MFCPHCGNELQDTAKFCTACGKQIKGSPAPKTDSLRKKKGLLIVICAVLVIGIAFCVILGIGRNIAEKMTAKVPDPVGFFGFEAQEHVEDDKITAMTFYATEDPIDAVCEYVDMLDERDDFELVLGDTDLKDSRYIIEYTDYIKIIGRNDTPWVIVTNKGQQSDGYYTFTVELMKKAEFVRCEKRVKTQFSGVDAPYKIEIEDIPPAEEETKEEPEEPKEPEVSEETPEEKPVVISGPTLPNPDAFFAGNIVRGEDFYVEKCGHWILSYEAEIDKGTLAMQEYVSLLCDERFNLELFHETEGTNLYLQTYEYYFNYTGEEDVQDITWDNYYGGEDNPDCDLGVFIQRNGKTGTALMTLYFKPDAYEFIDCGETTTYYVPKTDPNIDTDHSDDDDPYVPDFAKEPCMTCWGDKDCRKCDGKGTIKRYNGDGDYIDSECPDCHYSGDCPTCHGTGTR